MFTADLVGSLYALRFRCGRDFSARIGTLLGVCFRTTCPTKQGVSTSGEVRSITASVGCNSVRLGPLSEQLYMPDSVACALGLRLQGGEWERLLNKIDAAR